MILLKGTSSLKIKVHWISQSRLETSYEVTDAKQNNDGEDLGDHIIVKFLVNDGQPSNPSDDHEIVWETKLSQLKL